MVKGFAAQLDLPPIVFSAGHLRVAGWCRDDAGQPAREVRCAIDERRVTCPPIRALTASSSDAAPLLGFSASMRVRPGARLLRVEALLDDGSTRLIGRRLVLHLPAPPWPARDERRDYDEWVARYDRLSEAELVTCAARIPTLAARPRFAVVVRATPAGDAATETTVRSVRAQIYPDWSLDPGDGEWVVALEAGQVLRPHALYLFAQEIARHPDAEVVYGDHDARDTAGRRHTPFFKPDWDADYLLSQNYVGPFCAYRRARFAAADASAARGAGWSWEVALHATEPLAALHIRHVPRVVGHDVAEPPRTGDAALAPVVERTLARRGIEATVAARLDVGFYVRRHPARRPRVSLIIPTRNRVELLRRCLASLLSITDYEPYEIVVVDNDSDDAATLDYLEHLPREEPRVRVVAHPGPFNFPEIHNRLIPTLDGEIVGLLNNDLETLERGWLSEMVAHALRPEIGVVGAKLLFPHGTVQHAGIVLGLDHLVAHAAYHRDAAWPGDHGRAAVVSSFSALTGACFVLRRALYLEAGGMDGQAFPIIYNDVDLCLRLRRAGYVNLLVPGARFVHYESASRGILGSPNRLLRAIASKRRLQEKWQVWLDRDPAYNPNLSVDGEDFALAFPPRTALD